MSARPTSRDVVTWVADWRARNPVHAAALVAVPRDPVAFEAAKRKLTSDAVDAGGVGDWWGPLYRAAMAPPVET